MGRSEHGRRPAIYGGPCCEGIAGRGGKVSKRRLEGCKLRHRLLGGGTEGLSRPALPRRRRCHPDGLFYCRPNPIR
ncbi:hypothetical protein U1Q18_051422 [Sarracenia purpurea var. burkii]